MVYCIGIGMTSPKAAATLQRLPPAVRAQYSDKLYSLVSSMTVVTDVILMRMHH